MLGARRPPGSGVGGSRSCSPVPQPFLGWPRGEGLRRVGGGLGRPRGSHRQSGEPGVQGEAGEQEVAAQGRGREW